MNRNLFKHKKIAAAIILALTYPIANPVQAERKEYGLNHPFKVTDLPVQSKLRKRLEGLSETARQTAIAKMHTFSFPETDTELLDVDKNGGVFYSDTQKPRAVNAIQPAVADAIALPTVDTFQLHSRPDAINKLYLDFNGHTVTGTAWKSCVATYNAVSFSLDSDFANFSTDERSRIAETWHRIAEDYAPFDIDVTTEEPATFGPKVGRIVFTKDIDANGLAMPSQGAGGVAYVNVFGTSNYTYYSPGFVYYSNLGSGHPPYMAEAASHEFGHNLGLSHDGLVTGATNTMGCTGTGYFCGLGSGNTSWGPIMGVGYYTNVTEWSKGEYANANNSQDDMAIIVGKLQYKPDDIPTSVPLRVENDGSILVTTPQNDPSNADSANKGVIETRTDTDTFWFDAGSGLINITVKPAWAAYTRTSTRGANLDIHLELRDQSNNVVATNDPTTDTSATISTTLANAGRYYLFVSGVGNATVPYSDYGSVGEYFISGNVPPMTPDTTAPNPNPMSWAVEPALQGSSSITMTASTAIDDSNYVEYQFQCVSGGEGCSNSPWQTGTSYTATGLAGNTSYTYTVVARDAAGNTTGAAPDVSVTTASNQAPVANNDNATLNEDASIVIPVLANDTDADGNILTVSSVTTSENGIATNNGSSITYTPELNYYGTDRFTYTISDGAGGSATATVDLTINPVNDKPIASVDTATVKLRTTISINPLANDQDVDGDALAITAVSRARLGTYTLSNNTVNYTAGGKTGTESLSYTVSDGKGGTTTSTISIRITR